MASNYNLFKEKLQEIFMMDHAELDFGIYRIMNQKRDEINRFLNYELLPQVKQVLNNSRNDADEQRIQEIKAQFGNTDIMSLPDTIPAVAEYKRLVANRDKAGDTAALENEVFSHLTTFFGRYYDNGDFVSKRRYKDNAYAIPYNGEEVKLYWANNDQYYIKTSEYFQNYTFVLPESKRKVHFVLKDVTTEQNNNKAVKGLVRRFALYQQDGAKTIEIIENQENGKELNIFFTYELMSKGVKQDKLMEAAYATIQTLIPEGFEELIRVSSSMYQITQQI